jgi:hypothetical protein
VTGRVVLAADDAGKQLAIGPVYTEVSLDCLRQEAGEYGWKVTATVRHCPRAGFICARGRGEGLIREAAQ